MLRYLVSILYSFYVSNNVKFFLEWRRRFGRPAVVLRGVPVVDLRRLLQRKRHIKMQFCVAVPVIVS